MHATRHLLFFGLLIPLSVLAQTKPGFEPLSHTTTYNNFYDARDLAIGYLREAQPSLNESGQARARASIETLRTVMPYFAKSEEAVERCKGKDFLYSAWDSDIYLCSATTNSLSNRNDQALRVLAQRLIYWAHARIAGFRADACSHAEFELTVMSRTSTGIQTRRSIDETPGSCLGSLAGFMPDEEKAAPVRPRKTRSNEPSWSEVILGSLAQASQAYADQKTAIDTAQRIQDQRIAAEQGALYQQRLQQAQNANAAEEARRSQWEQRQAHQASQTHYDGTARSIAEPTNLGRARNTTQSRNSDNAVVSARFSHEVRDGGVSGRISNIVVYAHNTGNVAVDCDVWLKGAFWNDRAGAGMGPDEALSSINTERRAVIGLRAGERRQVMALSHHVAGSKFTYDGTCKSSFTN